MRPTNGPRCGMPPYPAQGCRPQGPRGRMPQELRFTPPERGIPHTEASATAVPCCVLASTPSRPSACLGRTCVSQDVGLADCHRLVRRHQPRHKCPWSEMPPTSAAFHGARPSIKGSPPAMPSCCSGMQELHSCSMHRSARSDERLCTADNLGRHACWGCENLTSHSAVVIHFLA